LHDFLFHRVWILVIHYTFSDDEDHSIRRPKNSWDVEAQAVAQPVIGECHK
jgi:hypothetical protein